MYRISIALALLVGVLAMVAAVAAANEILVLDDCDPASWNAPPPGGFGPGACVIDGTVTIGEFLGISPNPPVLPWGHPAWRNEPSYITIEPGDTVTAINDGGRRHTFTEVAQFGGGIVPSLNNPTGSRAVLPECGAAGALSSAAAATLLSPGASLEVTGLGVGTHLFQCCFHPWMHAAIKVKAD